MKKMALCVISVTIVLVFASPGHLLLYVFGATRQNSWNGYPILGQLTYEGEVLSFG